MPAWCELTLRPNGILSVLFPSSGGNFSQELVDLSEGGMAVVLRHPIDVGRRVRATMVMGPFEETFQAVGRVRHVRWSTAHPGRLVAGLEFLKPGGLLRVCIRRMQYECSRLGLVDPGRSRLAAMVQAR